MRKLVACSLLFCLGFPAIGNPLKPQVASYVTEVLQDFDRSYPEMPSEMLGSAWFFGGLAIDRGQFPRRRHDSDSPNSLSSVVRSRLKRTILAAILFVPLFMIFQNAETIEQAKMAEAGVFLMEAMVLVYPDVRNKIKDYWSLGKRQMRRVERSMQRRDFTFGKEPKELYLRTLQEVVQEEATRLKEESDQVYDRIEREGMGWNAEAFQQELLPKYIRLWNLAAILKVQSDKFGKGMNYVYLPFLDTLSQWIEDCRLQLILKFK